MSWSLPSSFLETRERKASTLSRVSAFGRQRPCSQNLTVECPTPSAFATSFWVRPDVTRAFRSCSARVEGVSSIGFQMGDLGLLRVFSGLRHLIVRWQIPNSATTLGTRHRKIFHNAESVESNLHVARYFRVPQSFAKILVHTIFSTKDRRPFLRDTREELHPFRAGVLAYLASRLARSASDVRPIQRNMKPMSGDSQCGVPARTLKFCNAPEAMEVSTIKRGNITCPRYEFETVR